MLKTILILYLAFALLNVIPCALGMYAASRTRPLNRVDITTFLMLVGSSLYGTVKIFRGWKEYGIFSALWSVIKRK